MTKVYDNATDLIAFARSSSGTALRRVGYGDELLVDGSGDWIGDFATDTDWTVNGSASISGGVANLTATNDAVKQDLTGTQGATVEVSFTANRTSGTNLRVYVGGSLLSDVSTPTGTYTYILKGGNTSNEFQIRSSGFVGTIDNVSVKEVIFDRPTDDLVLFNHPDDTPRIEYGSDGSLKGLLIEEQRTNFVVDSNVFSSDLGDTVTPAYALSPDRTQNAWLFTSEGDAAARISRNVSAVNSGADNTVSWFVRNIDADYVQLVNGGSGNLYCNFDLINGTVGTQGLGSTGGIENYGNGWYRIYTTWDGSTYNINPSNYLYIQNVADANYAVAGAAGRNVSVLVYGCQWEHASFPTSYIPTSGSQVTRWADVASIPVTAFGYNSTNVVGTFYAEFSSFNSAGFGRALTAVTDINRAVDVNMFPSTPRVDVYSNHTSGQLYSLDNASAGINRVAAAMAENNSAACVNGGTVKTSTATGVPVVATKIEIGRYFNSNFLNGHIKSLKYYPRRLTDAQLQELTA